MDFNIRLCGEAGQGLQSVGKILLSALAKQGLDVYAHQDYESRIRGGSNFFQIRVADHPITAFSEKVDLVIAMTGESFHNFSEDLGKDSIAIHVGPELENKAYQEMVVNFDKVASETGGSKKMASAVVAGLTWAFVANDTKVIEKELASFFADLGEELVQGNVKALHAGYNLAREKGHKARALSASSNDVRLLLRGNDAVALGAIAAGLKYISSYPMTPSTSIVEYIAAESEEAGIRVEQAEDEIAAINMAIGAGYTGVRSMTTTSGGGFCLMTEGIGLAGSAEIPVVIVNGQRPGPSTGLPTRTEQGDLLFAISAGHGDFPLAVIAPGSIEEAFSVMPHAFNMAEEYQVPVIVLTDQHLADSFQTIPKLDLNIPINRGEMAEPTKNYKRYKLTDSGVSPRVFPGAEPAVVVCAGDEHDEEGHLIEDAATRVAMMEKRMKKLELLRDKALPPRVSGNSNPELVLLTWGSTWGVAQQALEELGDKVRLIHLPQLWPLPADRVRELIPRDSLVYTVESNYSGQLAALLAMHGLSINESVKRYDGRPMTSTEILKFVREVL